ncbi:hypothetical protein CONPUDRAFT_162932 [Coniophora puteana RWD-64-598 SS2]|uniref:Uncharacterized protein n=1 Tax=Coniophora puteana (strain RWD-64-598) TaxID=741705 RepID=A0A5M3N4U2_CONPW|nr:uncharacterized protein CONPUDRAFT_162932 [Coniophora puteana RWD-64-598 SS2]EIW85865.1 hypothetical protein CONPUDRAFT_162932 [Coniophora puteana RWD-64-598 SS2]
MDSVLSSVADDDPYDKREQFLRRYSRRSTSFVPKSCAHQRAAARISPAAPARCIPQKASAGIRRIHDGRKAAARTERTTTLEGNSSQISIHSAFSTSNGQTPPAMDCSAPPAMTAAMGYHAAHRATFHVQESIEHAYGPAIARPAR